jgi:hypothetical protein
MDRVWQRQISTDQLEQLLEWLEREPEVSNGSPEACRQSGVSM